jgi:peptidyl-prolyl cis-trans isomerase SurA
MKRSRPSFGLVSGLALRLSFGLGVVALAAGALERRAEASIIERVVAVVGERPILLSELRLRARPHLYRIVQQTQNATQQAAAESEMFRELLNRLVEERLEETAADKAHLSVSADEVDNAVRQVAAQQKMSATQVVDEAKREGLTEQDYRDELRRQVLEGKLIQLRVRGRVRVTEQDARAAYGHWEKDVANESPVDLRILVLQIPPGSSQQTATARQVLGEELAKRARQGEDFCNLVQNFSEDPTTKSTCGSRGPTPKARLFPELQQIVDQHKPGETAAPFTFTDPMGNHAVLVVQVADKQPRLPPYEEVKEQMMERAFLEATERQRKLWLAELRRGVYIDVRL